MADEVKSTVAAKPVDSNIMAALSYLWILSVVFYVLKKDDDFVMFHSRQAMVIFGISVLGWATMWLIGFGFLLHILALVLMIIGALKAYKGERFKFPVVSDLAEKINF